MCYLVENGKETVPRVISKENKKSFLKYFFEEGISNSEERGHVQDTDQCEVLILHSHLTFVNT